MFDELSTFSPVFFSMTNRNRDYGIDGSVLKHPSPPPPPVCRWWKIWGASGAQGEIVAVAQGTHQIRTRMSTYSYTNADAYLHLHYFLYDQT